MTGSLTLGEVAFADFEIPEQIAIGGKQHLVVHMLPGGGRVVDAMGAEEGPLRWSGVFSGQQAADRVRLLERMRREGLPQVLTFDAWRYVVVIDAFDADVANSWWIPYRIKLCVVAAESVVAPDWLDHAGTPALAIGLVAAGALQSAISAAASNLTSADVGQAIGASGSLAQLETARVFGLFTP